MIDVVGHFGSRLSYATIADQLVQELATRCALGTITNLDDKFIRPELATAQVQARGKRVLLLADPQLHLVEALASAYGRWNVGIFVCPNTDALSPEREEACRHAGRIYTPSRWCADTILRRTLLGDPAPGLVEVMPLGVDAPFMAPWPEEIPPDPRVIKLLHVTTDTFWPGRKGTEELLQAWKLATPADATLTIHCLPQLFPALHQELGDLGLTDEVKLVASQHRGTTPEELVQIFSEHHMLVAPSRSEGFGVMPLSALMLGMPVLTTADTGQAEYLSAKKYTSEESDLLSLSGWLQIPTTGHAELFGEDGLAPVIRPDQLALSLLAGVHLFGRLWFRGWKRNGAARADWSWTTRRAAWVDSLLEWESRS